jgi:outer membrane cobalamin receptor
VFAGADNLFNAAYEQSYGFPQAGRIVYLGLDVAGHR